MATLGMKIRAEVRMRELLEAEGVPLPDTVEYGFDSLRLVWKHTKTVLVVDVNEYGTLGSAIVGSEPPV